MKTFSQYLFRSLLPGLLVALLVSGLLIQMLVSRSLTKEFDQSLIAKAESLMAITEQDEDGVELEVYSGALSRYFDENDPDYFEVHNSKSEQIFRSASLGPDEVLVSATREKSQKNRMDDVRLPDGRAGRSIQRSYYPKIDIDDDGDDNENVDGEKNQDSSQLNDSAPLSPFAPPGAPVESNGVLVVPELVQLTIATSRQSLDANLVQLNLILLLTGILTTSVVLFLLRGAIRRAVRPIEDISKQIKELDIDRMDRNVTLTHPIRELDVLTNRFNHLMESLQAGFERERRFSADLAHEIRTPLSELKTITEVLQRWPDDASLRETHSFDVLDSVGRMERLTQDLLALSRGDLGLITPSGKVELTKLIEQILQQHGKKIDTRRLSTVITLPPKIVHVTGQDQWIQMLDNLIDNACEYSPSESALSITLSLDDTNENFELTIENDTEDLTEEDLSHLFSRLWQKDRARSSTRHSGLGLSLVRMYARIVDVELGAELLHENKLRITLTGICNAADEQSI